MRGLYNALWLVALPFICLRLLLRSRKQPAYRQRMAERFSFYSRAALAHRASSQQPLIWLHAVSVGEFLAALPLIEHLLARGDCRLLITTTTPTGSAQVQAKLGARVQHVYAPYDLPIIVKRFLKQYQPRLLLVMETELWPNILRACRQRNLATVLVNGRMSARSARGYRRLGSLSRSMLADVSQALVQYNADGKRLVDLGLPQERLQVCGSVKFDIAISESLRVETQTLRNQWPHPLVWVAASTHPGEEQQIVAAHKQLQQQVPGALLVLVPRHPERSTEVLALCQNMAVVTRSSNSAVTAATDVLLVDTLGELMLFYGAADIAFVGGSLVAHGGHNLVEPAVWGKPVLSGPHVFNFATMAEEMTAAQALTTVADDDALAAAIAHWQAQPEAAQAQGNRGLQFAEANRGALQRVLMALAPYLPDTV
ncbi:lipid IV(A) 3-deoxy-D-manno-octulosonic acid transferase [Halioxenophilus aromaticivorans]|uniref:3-deoxy-D-manno-octulosonic acid transferase n=1 Tax=Halioxenophilus aromaticivorans TaxID=1306992 RepID=A0AAV3U227_9ALTE